MNIYENIVIINASLSDEEIEAANERIKDLITRSGGEILKVEPWGRKKLAYEIKKHKKGFYTLLTFRSEPSLIKKLEDYYRVSDFVVKYMIIKMGKKEAAHFLETLSQAETAMKATPAEASAA
jgi:small subunit ribosomal protein S6